MRPQHDCHLPLQRTRRQHAQGVAGGHDVELSAGAKCMRWAFRRAGTLSIDDARLFDALLWRTVPYVRYTHVSNGLPPRPSPCAKRVNTKPRIKRCMHNGLSSASAPPSIMCLLRRSCLSIMPAGRKTGAKSSNMLLEAYPSLLNRPWRRIPPRELVQGPAKP